MFIVIGERRTNNNIQKPKSLSASLQYNECNIKKNKKRDRTKSKREEKTESIVSYNKGRRFAFIMFKKFMIKMIQK